VQVVGLFSRVTVIFHCSLLQCSQNKFTRK